MKDSNRTYINNAQLSLMQIAEISISYNLKFKASERPMINSSASAYEILIHQWNPGLLELKEEFKVILLNRANNVLGLFNLSSGGMAGTVVDLKLLFATVLKSCASTIILAHNHPSGNLIPSQADISITQQVKEAGKILDIKVFDHLIITKSSYYSFADEGIL